MRLSADDRTAIGDPVSRYNMAHDTGDAERWLDTFTDDAVFVTGRSHSEGREQLRRFFLEGGEPPAPPLTRRYRDTLRRGADGERRSGRREIAPG